jgi:hypothetical protein
MMNDERGTCPARVIHHSSIIIHHFARPSWYNETNAAPGAQRERPGLVGPVSVPLASVGSPAASLPMMKVE